MHLPRTSSRERALALLTVLLVLAGVVVIAPPAAQANVNGLFPSDAGGTITDQFVNTDALFVYTVVDVAGGRICVVDEADTKTCDDPAWGTPNPVFGIGTLFTLIEGPSLKKGTWRLRGEVENNGTWVESALSDPFTVNACVGAQCTNGIGAAAAQAFKQSAGNIKGGTDTACLSFATADVLGGKGISGKAKQLPDAVKAYNDVQPSFASGLAAIAGGVAMTFLPELSIPTTTKALELFKEISCKASAMFLAIKNDPPDPAYFTVAAPRFGSLPAQSNPQAATLASHLDKLDAYGQAALTAYERYQGAVNNANPSKARLQARAAETNTATLISELHATSGALRAYATVLAGDSATNGIVATPADKALLITAYQRVRATGFTADELAQLTALGYTPTQIDGIKSHFAIPIEDLPTDKTLAQISTDLADLLEANVAGIDQFSREAGAFADNDAPPTADFTSQDLGGGTWRFTATSTSPDGDPLTHSWTFGDGLTGTGPVVDHTFTSSSTRTITLDSREPFLQATAAHDIVVISPIPGPTAAPDAAETKLGTPITIDVLANDTAAPGATLTVSAFDANSANGGQINCSSAGQCHYTTPINGTGADTFHYTLTASIGGTATGLVTVLVKPLVNTPPNANSNTLSLITTGALDVLANDSDPDLDPLTVTGHTDPAHGTVTCGALGACFYQVTGSYTGPDSFDYTISDGHGGTASTTVAVTVVPAVAGNRPPVARPDTIATQGMAQGVANVLANDDDPDGDPVTVKTTTDPAHGALSCTAAVCTYVAHLGFSGIDGFSYTIEDPAHATATTTVKVLVAPADGGFAPRIAGAPVASGPDVPAGGQAAWTVGATPDPAGLPQELAAGVGTPTIAATVQGGHAIDPASVTTAPGWTWNPGTGQFVAGPDALLGDATVEAFPAPQPPVSQGSGGDGHVPILVGTKVFGFFHHSNPTSVTCVDRATGQLCPGYPKVLNQGTTDLNGPAAVVGTKIWVHLLPQQNYDQSRPISLFCWDAATDASCGMVIVDRFTSFSGAYGNPGASAPRLVGNEIWVAGGPRSRAYCLDATTATPCPVASVPLDLALSGDQYFDIVTHGTRLYVSSNTGRKVACIDTAAKAPCVGWSFPTAGDGFNLITRHNSAGAATGVCILSGISTMRCANDDASATVDQFANWPYNQTYWGVTEEAETGTRTLFSLHGSGGLGCWDWTTNTGCTGGAYTGGAIYSTTANTGLPSAYGAVFDGSCVVALGDPGLVFTVDPAGSAPCTSLRSGAARTVDLRQQRCDGTVGSARWAKAKVSDTDLTNGVEFTSLVVTVRDATTNEVLLSQQVVGTAGEVDLTGIDPIVHPSLSIDANATSVLGNPAWADGAPPQLTLTWTPDPAQGCFRTTAAPQACVGTVAGGQIGATAVLGEADPVEAGLHVLPPACAPVASDAAIVTDQETAAPVGLGARDPNDDPLTFLVVTPPAHGTLSAVAGAAVTYTPDPGYHGPDSFTYRANDGALDSNVAAVRITVNAVAPTTTTTTTTSTSSSSTTSTTSTTTPGSSNPTSTTTSTGAAVAVAVTSTSPTVIAATGSLPVTGGSGPSQLALAGLGLLIGGGALTLSTRRRRAARTR